MAQTTVAINLEAKTKGTESVKSLKTQIREATQDAAAMAQKFGEFSPQAIAATKRVAELKDQMQDLQQRVQALNPDKFEAIGKVVGGVASGFTAAQGAMALFGAESEDVQKSLLKVQGAMALAQGMQGLLDAGKQFRALGQSAVAAFNSMTTASKVFLATGIGLLITAIGYVAANFDDLAKSLGFAKSEMDKMNKAMNVAAAETKTQAADLNFYNTVVQDTTKSEGEREFALQKLKEAGIATDDVNIANANSLGKLNDRVAQQIVLIAQRARVEASAQILQEKTKKLIEMQNGDLDDATSLWDKFVAGAKGAFMGAAAGAEEYQKRGLNNINEAQKEVTQATQVYQKELEKNTKLEGVAVATSKAVTSTLKNQKQATRDLAQEELQRRATMLAIDQTTLDKAIAAADAAFAVKVKQLKEQGFTEVQIATMRDAELEKVRTAFYDKQKADDKKAADEKAEFQKKQNESLLKANDTYFKAAQTQLIERNASQAEFDALELERLQANLDAQKAINDANSAEVVAAEAELAAKKKDIYDKDAKAKEDTEKAKRAAEMATLESASSIIGSLGQLFGQSEKEQKAFGLAQIAVDTAKALTAAQANAMAPTPDNVATSGAAGFAKYAGYVAIILSNVARARALIKGSGGGGGGGGGAAAAPAAPSFAPTVGGGLPDEQQFGGMGRVYVLEGDITKTQTRVRRLRNTSVV
jgi:hypothetical protein